MLESEPAASGWGLWYVVRDEPGAPRVLIGNGGFKGKPVDGCCEIGYSLLPGHQRFGYATEAARALVKWAFEHPEVNRVSAETLPELTASIRVMEKCGMRYVGDGVPEQGLRTVRYQIAR
jgi:RimJ/RimL family protein N-acetyltransferase